MKKFKYRENDWFKQEKTDKKKFFTIELNEKDENSRMNIKNSLIEVLIHYYIEEETIEYYLDDNERFSELEHIIKEDYIPDFEAGNTRKGDFSEIISSEHLVQNYEYYFPYIKLQNKPNKNESNPGDDILGFIFNDNGDVEEIGVSEVKFSSNFSNGVFRVAHNQLRKSYTPKPKSLRMIVNYAVKQNDSHKIALQKILSTKKFSNVKITNWLFCITETLPKNLHVPHEDELLNNLTLVSIYLPNIVGFINEIYDLSSGYYNER